MANTVPNFSGFQRGITVPVVRPAGKGIGEQDGLHSGVAVGFADIRGKFCTVLTLRHPDGECLTGILTDEMMVKLCDLIRAISDDAANAAVTNKVAH